MSHSSIVGGSTAKRVIVCPGSVALVDLAPPSLPSAAAEEGTLLHDAVERAAKGLVMTHRMGLSEEHLEKVRFCLDVFDEIDPVGEGDFRVEARVAYDWDARCFGTADVIGKVGDTTYLIDWKFGAHPVDAEENDQLLFYAAAAMQTLGLERLCDTERLVLMIVQPFEVRRWETTWERVREFERSLYRAVRAAAQPNAPLRTGDHCKFCPARGICPAMTDAVERVTRIKLEALDDQALGRAMDLALGLESFIEAAKRIAMQRLEADLPVRGYKLVAKRAVRKWADEARAHKVLGEEFMEHTLMSPAAAEKVLKQRKQALPPDLVVAVSSGSTVAPESDPRPAVLNIGRQLTAALSKVS